MSFKWLIILPVILVACNNTETTEVPRDAEVRRELYREIATNDEYMREFRDVARETGHGRMMMEDEEHHHMRGEHMYEMDDDMDERRGQMNRDTMQFRMRRMLQLCLKDTSYCTMMGNMMAGSKPMMRNMMQNMHDHGMMSEECMQAGMESLK